MAGVGSGKSHVAAYLSAKYISNFPEAAGFIGANSYDQLSRSTLKRVFDVWFHDFGWQNDVHYVVDKQPHQTWPVIHQKLKTYRNVISFDNGAIVFVASLENYEQVDGVELGYAILDETKDTREEAVKEVILARLRQKCMYIDQNGLITSTVTKKAFNPLYILTSPAKVPWINEMFDLESHIDKINEHIYSETDFFKLETSRQKIVIASTFHNRKNLPPGYIEGLVEDYKLRDPRLVDMLIYGNPIAKTGGEFYHAFERSFHVRPTKYNPALALHVAFDFNVKPYITALVFQVALENGRYKVRGLKEYTFRAPKNNAEDLSAAIMYDYFVEKKHDGLAFIYGDASGKNRSSLTRNFSHHYEVIQYYMREMLSEQSLRFSRKNPPVVKRRDFCNVLFSGRKYPIDIEFDPSMKETIADMEYCKEGPDGGKKKDVVRNKETGDYEELRGHTGDAYEYFVCAAFEDFFYGFGNRK